MADQPSAVSVWIKAFIPKDIPGLTKVVSKGKAKGMTAIEGPVDDWYLTDMRAFRDIYLAKARLTLGMFFKFDDIAKAPYTESYCDETTAVDPDDWTVQKKTGRAKHKVCYIPRQTVGNIHEFSISLSGCNPFFGFGPANVSPDIDVEGKLEVDTSSGKIRWTGSVDNFPAFEMYKLPEVDVTRLCASRGPQQVFVRFPQPGMSPKCLWGGASNLVATPWI